jgi:flagellar hook-basal body complex protein FliE
MKDITIESSLPSMIPHPSARKEHAPAEGGSFKEMLKGSIDDVNQLQTEADRSIERLIAGESKSLHETMIAMEKADISFRLMMEVRNKIVEAYNEIMRIPV